MAARPAIYLSVAILLTVPSSALALITGGAGNAPIHDPGWPKGAAGIFNHTVRIAWWEGPPFGGGQWHAEFRGDAGTLNAMLQGFAKLDVKTKRIVVHDGVGSSFWLNPNGEASKSEAARMDWAFMVWQPDHWRKLRDLPPDFNPTDPKDADKGPPAQFDVYTGGKIRWADVVVPQGLEVVDERLEAHGFHISDGVVLEGNIHEIPSGQPLAAQVKLERVEPQSRGGYAYPLAADTRADAKGYWVLRKVPPGWYRVVVQSDGFAARVAAYGKFDEQPRYVAYDCGLARQAMIRGQVTDEAGKPLADVKLRVHQVTADSPGRYECAAELAGQSDASGRFRFEQLPTGRATIFASKFGHVGPGLGMEVKTPAEGVTLVMKRSARLRVRVDFGKTKRPAEYLVDLEPEGGLKVGSWGGSRQVDEHGETVFTDIPAGRYVVRGHPNPHGPDELTEPVPVDLKGGRLTEVVLSARPVR